MAVERDIEIAASPSEVFAFVADARNDPDWCPTVKACEQRSGAGPGAGASYLARHKPTPFHRVMPRQIEVLDFDPPHRMRTRQEDSNGIFEITYEVHGAPAGSRLIQRDEIAWKVPSVAGRFAERVFVRRHISEQMTRLKELLERR